MGAAYNAAVQSQRHVSGPIPNRLGIVNMLTALMSDNTTHVLYSTKLQHFNYIENL